MATAEIVDAPPSLKFHTFTEEISATLVTFEVLKLKDSLFIWIGGESRMFSDLGMAMPLSSTEITTTRLLGSVHLQTASDLLTRRITTKLKKPVYLSYNLQMEDNILMKAVEKRLHEEIVSHAECF